jgi:hypothetical protein
MTNHQHLVARYLEQNRICSEIILSTIKKYGGEGSLMIQWARMLMARTDAAGTAAGPPFDRREQFGTSNAPCGYCRPNRTEVRLYEV